MTSQRQPWRAQRKGIFASKDEMRKVLAMPVNKRWAAIQKAAKEKCLAESSCCGSKIGVSGYNDRDGGQRYFYCDKCKRQIFKVGQTFAVDGDTGEFMALETF